VSGTEDTKSRKCRIEAQGQAMREIKTKLKVIPEGRDGVYLCEKEDIIQWLNESGLELIYNFIAGGPCMIGCDWELESVIEEINKSERIGILTGEAQRGNMRHALSVISKNTLYMFDIGEIKEEDLEVIHEEKP